MTQWQATAAKAKFSAVLDLAETEGPQLVQRRKQRFVLLTEEELQKRTAHNCDQNPARPLTGKSAWDLLRAPKGSRFDLKLPDRGKWTPRKVGL